MIDKQVAANYYINVDQGAKTVQQKEGRVVLQAPVERSKTLNEFVNFDDNDSEMPDKSTLYIQGNYYHRPLVFHTQKGL